MGILLFVSLWGVAWAGQQKVAKKPTPATQIEKNKKTPPAKPPQEKVNETTAALIKATEEYKQTLDRLIALYEADATNEAQRLDKLKQLFEEGIIARKELETQNQKIEAIKIKIQDAKRQQTQADELIAEVQAMDAMRDALAANRAGTSYGTKYIRYVGANQWNIGNFGEIDRFFIGKFGRSLPTSAFGQSATHDQLRYDHHNAVDVPLHPDSAEGLALMDYLRSRAIPFMAFRTTIPNSSTGAHIHIGTPSRHF
ncbi:MAG: hypothetical protein K1Y36_11355 [Blastocatellia bacterium]|nr:hypothetical protein [Blastocatellia bacterium]